MLCTRCHQREAISLSPEKRAQIEEFFGAKWPFPDGLCKDCLKEMWNSPDQELRKGLETFRKATSAKVREMTKAGLRSAALRALDFADDIVKKF